jgi:riboflavin kinase / FMN adenylyltransferase
MRHLRSLNELSLQNTWLTIGAFDGVHQGHQKIVTALVAEAHTAEAQAVVLTFDPHPAIVLGRRTMPYYLTLPEERAELLGKLGVDVVITQTFDHELASTTAHDYILLLKNHIGFLSLWIGQDFALGRNREGDVNKLKELGQEFEFEVHVQRSMENEGQVISSSLVRNMVLSGDVKQAQELLGRAYFVSGKVVPGDQRGRMIGIPTANLEVSEAKILPMAGVYACKAFHKDQVWPAATNIGVRPTFDGQGKRMHLEAHLIGFSGDLYEQVIRLEFVERLRNEQRFESIDGLVAQIHLDIERTRQLIAIPAL